jgi:uncharacterized protein YdhG (YjbR/CyaY superfamily)
MKNFVSIDEYIATFPKNVQMVLQQIRQAVKDAAPKAEEAISYNMPAFKLNGNLVWFGAFKNHIGFYPRESAIEEFKEKLSAYEVSKVQGTVKFPLDKPVPLDSRYLDWRCVSKACTEFVPWNLGGWILRSSLWKHPRNRLTGQRVSAGQDAATRATIARH